MTERVAARAALSVILAVALAWRLNNIGFGLPSMYDPDEPIFMITALKLLGEGTLNPGWFGHPGSTTIYLVALIDAAVASWGLITGRYADVADFAQAAYADPALLFVPARAAMALLGVGAVWLTYFLGRKMQGVAVGLIGAGLLAINALHIAWSQVVRTDIHASVFMLASMLFAIRAMKDARLRNFLIAGAFAGFATATKWPAATVFAGVIAAAVHRAFDHGEGRRPLLFLAASGAASLAAVFVASPFIFLDWQTVLANVSGEVKAGHLGHTGGGFVANLVFYIGQVTGAMGAVGGLLVVFGAGFAAARSQAARWVVLPVTLVFLVLICAQGLVWSRWVLPLLPMACLFVAMAIVAIGRFIARKLNWKRTDALVAGLALCAAIPSATAAIVQARERANDTRARAAEWAAAHIPPGSRVVFEHLEIRLRHQPWHILFPIGEAGCIDALRALATGVRFEEVQRLRKGSPIIDLGNVSGERLGSCRADYAVLTYFDLYRKEAGQFPREVENYRKLLAGGRTVALFRPEPGRAGGPVVRIVALPQH